MPCVHPLPGYRSSNGTMALWKQLPDSTYLPVPCGTCIACRKRTAQGWALRCQLELQEHHEASFATLTYDDGHLPATLSKPHLQLFLRKLRKKVPDRLRFFAAGEYGTQNTHRPHYHAIIYGLPLHTEALVQDTWNMGHARLDHVTPASISYVAGYVADKLSLPVDRHEPRIDYTTGEEYWHQPPFRQMSRKPGIGAHARQWVNSWRQHAVTSDGKPIPVPPYLHNAWKAQASNLDLEDLDYERHQHLQHRDYSPEALANVESNLLAARNLQTQRRTL